MSFTMKVYNFTYALVHARPWMFTKTYNQTFSWICAPSSEMRVKDWSYSFITHNFRTK